MIKKVPVQITPDLVNELRGLIGDLPALIDRQHLVGKPAFGYLHRHFEVTSHNINADPHYVMGGGDLLEVLPIFIKTFLDVDSNRFCLLYEHSLTVRWGDKKNSWVEELIARPGFKQAFHTYGDEGYFVFTRDQGIKALSECDRMDHGFLLCTLGRLPADLSDLSGDDNSTELSSDVLKRLLNDCDYVISSAFDALAHVYIHMTGDGTGIDVPGVTS